MVSAFSWLGALVGLITTVIGSLVLGAMTIANQDGKVGVSSFFGGLVEGFGIIVRSVVPALVNAETVTAAILAQCLRNAGRLPAGDHVRACGESGSGHGDFHRRADAVAGFDDVGDAVRRGVRCQRRRGIGADARGKTAEQDRGRRGVRRGGIDPTTRAAPCDSSW